MAKGPEAKVKDKVVNILKHHDAWYCFPATRGMGRSGVPDILVCHRGTFIAIEVKRDAKHPPSKLQEHELWKIQSKGGWACIIHKDNLLDLEGLLSTISAAAELTRLEGHDKLEAMEEEAAQSRQRAEEHATKVDMGEAEATEDVPTSGPKGVKH